MDFDIRDDADLLQALREALATGTHPRYDLVVANAQDAFGYRDLDEELAQLVYDSLLDAGAPSLTRAGDDARVVVFENDALSVELEIIGDSIVGQVAPPSRALVVVEVAGQDAVRLQTDELGCFSMTSASAGALGRGPLRLQIERDHTKTVTEWTRVPPQP